MSNKPKRYTYGEIAVGQRAEFEMIISEKLIADFSLISGDKNPLHIDQSYAETTIFKRPIAHGMIAGLLFSRLIGMELPGASALYLSQQLQFHRPMYAGDTVIVSGTIVQKTDSYQTINLETEIRDKISDEIRVSGQALIRVLS